MEYQSVEDLFIIWYSKVWIHQLARFKPLIKHINFFLILILFSDKDIFKLLDM